MVTFAKLRKTLAGLCYFTVSLHAGSFVVVVVVVVVVIVISLWCEKKWPIRPELIPVTVA